MRLNFAATPRRAASRHYNWSLIATWYAQSCAERCTPVRAGSVWESAWPTAAVGTRGAALWEMPPRFQATHKLSASRLGVGEDLFFFAFFMAFPLNSVIPPPPPPSSSIYRLNITWAPHTVWRPQPQGWGQCGGIQGGSTMCIQFKSRPSGIALKESAGSRRAFRRVDWRCSESGARWSKHLGWTLTSQPSCRPRPGGSLQGSAPCAQGQLFRRL